MRHTRGRLDRRCLIHGTCSSILQGTRLELRYFTGIDGPTRGEIGALAAQAWGQIGVKIDYPCSGPGTPLFCIRLREILTNPDPYSSPDKTRLDITELTSFGTLDPDDHLSWDCNATPANAGANYGYYCDPQVDALEAQQLKEPDQTRRAAIFHQLYQVMLGDVPNMFLFSPPTLSVGSTRLHNYNPSAFGPTETWNVQRWWIS